MTNAFVGRKSELDALRRRLSDSFSNHGSLCLITGDPGIGKSRLADEIAIEARSRGALILWARSFDDVSAPAYWPWTQALRTVLDSAGFLSSLPTARSTISTLRLIPELRGDLAARFSEHPTSESDVVVVNEAEPDAHRFILFDAVATILKEVAVNTPLVLVLDDLQGFDPDSLLLLQFVVQQIRNHSIFAIGTYRKPGTDDSSRIRELINAIARAGTSIQLSGLQEKEIGEFVEVITGELPNAGYLKELRRRTEGNPFFLEEILRTGHQHGTPSTNIPEGVRFAVQSRLESLREPVRALLRIASVIGGEFDVRLLNALTATPVDESIGLLSEASRQGLISQVPNAVHRYRFTHGLFAETIYHALPKPEAIQLHLRIARSMEALYQSDTHLAQLAHHYCQALPVGPADKAIHFCREAALRARKSCAYEDAMQFYQAALNALEVISSPDPGLKLHILNLLGEVSFAAGLFAQSRSFFHDAIEIARSTSDYQEFARAVLGFAAAPTDAGTVNHERVRLLKEALDLLVESDDLLRARLMAKLAWEVYWSEPSEVAESLTVRALEIARRLQEDEALIEVLFYRHQAVWSPDNLAERLAITDELLKRCEGSERRLGAMRAHYLRIADLLELGKLSDARAVLEKYSSIAHESGFSIGYGELAQASCCLIEGNLEQGERWSEEALRIGLRQELRGRRHREAHTFYMISLRREQGRAPEMEPIAQKLSARGRVPLIRAILAVYYAEIGNVDNAKSEFDRLVAGGLDRIRRDSIWLATMALAARASIYLSDRDRAEELYSLLLPYAERNAVIDIYVSYGPVTYYLGLLAELLGRTEEARAHFKNAIESSEKAGAFLFLTQSLAAYAAMLLELKSDTETANAHAALDRGLTLAKSLGLTRCVSQLQALEGSQSAVDANAPSDSDFLFRDEGDCWTIAFNRKPSFRLSNSKGLKYLAILLKNPGTQIHALDLIKGGAFSDPDSQSATMRKMSGDQLADVGMRIATASDSGEMLDAQAKVAYRKRLSELRVSVEEAKSHDDIEGAAELEEEIEILMGELSRAVGLRGRDRRAGSDSERARLNATRTLKNAINRIGEKDPEMALHLSKTVRTGIYCSYTPLPREQSKWRF